LIFNPSPHHCGLDGDQVPGAIGDASLATAAQAKDGGRQLSWFARNGRKAFRGRKLHTAIATGQSRLKPTTGQIKRSKAAVVVGNRS